VCARVFASRADVPTNTYAIKQREKKKEEKNGGRGGGSYEKLTLAPRASSVIDSEINSGAVISGSITGGGLISDRLVMIQLRHRKSLSPRLRHRVAFKAKRRGAGMSGGCPCGRSRP